MWLFTGICNIDYKDTVKKERLSNWIGGKTVSAVTVVVPPRLPDVPVQDSCSVYDVIMHCIGCYAPSCVATLARGCAAASTNLSIKENDNVRKQNPCRHTIFQEIP